MTSSSSPVPERGLDSMILVYSLLRGHPATIPCRNLLRTQSGWFTSPLVLLEAWTVLVKVYAVTPVAATKRVARLGKVPITIVDLDDATVSLGLQLANSQGLDLTDSVLLQLTRQVGAKELATDDAQLVQSCAQFGIAAQSPIDNALRQQITAWETANLAPKGLARVLRRVHQWLNQSHVQAAQDFWHQTGAGSHLP